MSDDASTAGVPTLTIDGPSGSGKGTISRLVAARLGWHYLDSGALYRAVGLAAGWSDIDLSDASALVRCAFDTTVGFAGCAIASGPSASPQAWWRTGATWGR